MKQHFTKLAGAVLIGMTIGLTQSISASAGVIEDRQARFKANNGSMRAIGAALGSGDVAVIKAEATKIAEWAKVMPDYFPKGSDGAPSSAKSDLWENFDLFRKQAEDNHQAALALIAAADSSDMDKARGALMEVGATCKACHQNFKGY